ncbi:hypothetical protein PAHAL_6G021100 [Panicum hallii]|uniref:Amino acid transporter transmembrane domain-containing protein n=1 Tax=Panicum hallii TaxID=206008 RepID=A0A2T8IEY8_9POAL|nr:hypothetical protein PAHAL_6G021100 [Panicum hallii]
MEMQPLNNCAPAKEGRSAQEKSIDDWLPINASRNAKWWYSASRTGAISGLWVLVVAQVYAMPVFDMIETVLVRKFRFRPGLTLRLIARTLYVGFTMFVAITFPFFSALLSFFGGFAFAPTTYFLPCIMWLTIYKPKRFSLSWFTNWICIVLGVLLMVLSPIGGLRQIILKAKTYKFYQ